MSESILNETSRRKLVDFLRDFFEETGCTNEFLVLANGKTEVTMVLHVSPVEGGPRFKRIVADLKQDNGGALFDVTFEHKKNA